MIFYLRLLLLAGLLLWAAYQDMTVQRIPNFLTAGAACLGFLLALFSDLSTLRASLIGFFAALLIGMLLWLFGAFRAGDAKLYASLGMVMGWQGVLNCFLWSMLIAGCMGFLLLLLRGSLGARCKRLWLYVKTLLLTRSFVPYSPEPGTEHEFPLAAPIALGGLLSLCFPLLTFS